MNLYQCKLSLINECCITWGIEVYLEFKLTGSFASLNRINMPSIENINYNNTTFIPDKLLTNYSYIRSLGIKKYIYI